MTIAAWICGVLSFLLAWLIAFAVGMKTVPRFSNGNLLLACLLPSLAILLAVASMVRGGEGGRRPVGNGGALILALSTMALALQGWAFQPSTPEVAKKIRLRLGLGADRWKPDRARWASGNHEVVYLRLNSKWRGLA